jgi:hypothetical protein
MRLQPAITQNFAYLRRIFFEWQSRATSTGQQEQDSLFRTAGTAQPGQHSWNSIARTRQPEQDRTGWSEHESKDMTLGDRTAGDRKVGTEDSQVRTARRLDSNRGNFFVQDCQDMREDRTARK